MKLSRTPAKITLMVCLSVLHSPRKCLNFSVLHFKCLERTSCTNGKSKSTLAELFHRLQSWGLCCLTILSSQLKWWWSRPWLRFMRPISWRLNHLTSKNFLKKCIHLWNCSTNVSRRHPSRTWRGTWKRIVMTIRSLWFRLKPLRTHVAKWFQKRWLCMNVIHMMLFLSSKRRKEEYRVTKASARRICLKRKTRFTKSQCPPKSIRARKSRRMSILKRTGFRMSLSWSTLQLLVLKSVQVKFNNWLEVVKLRRKRRLWKWSNLGKKYLKRKRVSRRKRNILHWKSAQKLWEKLKSKCEYSRIMFLGVLDRN